MVFLLLTTVIVLAFFRIPPHWSILLGVVFALTFNIPSELQKRSKDWASKILQGSIVLLGASLNFQSVIKEGLNGLIVTSISIATIFILGHLLAKIFKVESPLSTLLTIGTSICGGSAISAISGIIRADSLSMATALGIVFILNAISVFLFTEVGYLLNLSQEQFGTWAALAIHDTSSVVAASQIYGQRALEVGTTLKLTRALWILPLAVIFGYLNKSQQKAPFPWFIVFFSLVSILFTFNYDFNFLIPIFSSVSKMGFSVTLFLIGSGLNKTQIKSISWRPLAMGILLWILTSIGSLYFVMYKLN